MEENDYFTSRNVKITRSIKKKFDIYICAYQMMRNLSSRLLTVVSFENLTHIMGLTKSKTTNNTRLNGEQSSLLSSCGSFRSKDKYLKKRRICSKKKVLMLGLDRSGKTDLFYRLISCDQPSLKIDAFPQPTMGKLRIGISLLLYNLFLCRL